MLTESFIASTLLVNKASSQLPSSLKDVGICVFEVQPQTAPREGFKKSSTPRNCLAISENHVFAAQADKAVVNVYSRERSNQEATVPFPERVHSLAYAEGTGILVLGTEGGRLLLWETASGRVTTSAASHIQPVTSLCLTVDRLILSASVDSSIHVWSLPRLVSFSQPSDSYTNEPSLGPIRTFSNHRNAITALACGSSKSSTNFAVSVSKDRNCYVWSIDTCQILQTYLLPSTPLCVCVDVADRAAFAGYEDGSIQRIDFFGAQDTGYNRIQNGVNNHPIQLESKSTWPATDSDSGAVECICLSHDGTSLFSGTNGGKIHSWDVSKGRFQKTIVDLGQPVTTIQVLTPDGIRPRKGTPSYQIKSIVKPRLELSSKSVGTCAIPRNYSLEVQIVKSAEDHDDFQKALTCPCFCKDMIDEALYEMQTHQLQVPDSAPSDAQLLKIDRLEDEVDTLSGKLEYFMDLMEQSRVRRLARKKAREEFGMQKRQAFFAAKDQGEDGDAAMVEWEEKEREVDEQSDQEELGTEVYADVG